MKFLLKRVESVFYFALVLFAFPSFAQQPWIGCNPTAPLCAPGLDPLVLDSGFGEGTELEDHTSVNTCICLPSGHDVESCPTGSTQVKRPVPIARTNSYQINCGAAVEAGDGRAFANPRRLYDKDHHGLYLQSCWTTIRVNKADLKNRLHCSTRIRIRMNKDPDATTVPLMLRTTCKSWNTCRKTLNEMIAGKRTFWPFRSEQLGRGARRYLELQCASRDCNNSTSTIPCSMVKQYRRGSSGGNKIKYACTMRLYDRVNDIPVPDTSTLSDHEDFVSHVALFTSHKDWVTYVDPRSSAPPTQGPFPDMQCISDNISVKEFCECNNGDYEFEMGQVDSCLCPDGTAKSSDGSCSDTCPSGSYAVNDGGVNECACSYSCPNGCGSFTVNVQLNSPSCPDSPTPPASACQCPTINKCPNEQGWDNNDPLSPIHPYVSGPFTDSDDDNNQNDVTQRCPNGGALGEHGGVDVCKTAQHCSKTTDEQSCRSQNSTTSYGQCQRKVHQFYCQDSMPSQARDVNTVCPIGWSEISGPGGYNIDPRVVLCKTPDGASAIVVSEPQSTLFSHPSPPSPHRGVCWAGGSTPFVRLDTSHPFPDPNCQPGKIKVTLKRVGMVQSHYEVCANPIFDSEVSGNPNLTGAYTCPEGGTPSSQDASCECRTTVTEQGCDHLPDHIRQADITSGTCNCPSGWGNPDGNGKCSKTPSGPDITETIRAQYEGNYDGDGSDLYLDPGINTSLPVNQGIPRTKQLNTNPAGWTCTNNNYSGGLSRLFNRQPTHSYTIATCTKTTTTKECPDGGTYNTGTQKCEMSCIQESNIQGCKCVKGGTSCGCAVGWTPVGDECHQDALPRVSPNYCTCQCYKPRNQKDVKFYLGNPRDDVEERIKEDIRDNPTDPGVCVEFDEFDPDKCGRGPTPSCCYQGTVVRPCTTAIKNLLIAGGHPINVVGDGTCSECPDGNKVPASPGGCCPNGVAISDLNQCGGPTTGGGTTGGGGGFHMGGDPKGIDIAFRGNSSYFYSVYSTGSMDRPDYICWRRIPTRDSGYQKVQMRGLICPSRDDCGGEVRDPVTNMCQCQSLDASDNVISHEKTYCEYASRDPMRFEDGIVRGDVPSSRENDKYHTDIRFFKTNIIATPGGR